MGIHVVQPNPALDRIEVLARLEVGGVNRSSSSIAVAGGKGLNVARALRRLGHPVAVYGFLGGRTGDSLRESCRRLGITDRHVQVEGETRTCTIVVESETGRSTVINERGPRITAEDERRLLDSVLSSCLPHDVVVAVGSLPPGSSPESYGRLIRETQSAGARVVVDASGPALRAALEADPWMIKVNAIELADLGFSAETLRDDLRGRPTTIVATLGADGAIAVSGGRRWSVSVPETRPVNPTGAGDIFLAGLLGRLEEGDAMPAALRFAAAVAAGSVLTLEPELPDEPTRTRLLEATRVTED